MNRHEELLRALPPALTLSQVAVLLRVPFEDVLLATTRLAFTFDEQLRVRTGPLLADLGITVREVGDDPR